MMPGIMGGAPPAKKRKIANATLKTASPMGAPTPEVTPAVGTISSPGQAFGGFNSNQTAGSAVPDHVARVVEMNRAWSVAAKAMDRSARRPGAAGFTEDEVSAFAIVFSDASKCSELARFYIDNVRENLDKPTAKNLHVYDGDDEDEDLGGISHLWRLRTRCIVPTIEELQDTVYIDRNAPLFEHLVNQFDKELRDYVRISVTDSFSKADIASDLYISLHGDLVASLHDESETSFACVNKNFCGCRISLGSWRLHRLRHLGLSGLGEDVLAKVFSTFIRVVIVKKLCFAVDWEGQESVIPRLRQWVSDQICSTVTKGLQELHGESATIPYNLERSLLSEADAAVCDDRIHNLLEYVKTWPRSKGAVLDIKTLLVDPEMGPKIKSNLCMVFTLAVGKRLLHAGVSTVDLFSFYISTIHVFKMLDPRGVLLAKVSQPIRAYLRGRDDTVTIIAASFLADVEKDLTKQDSQAGVCLDFAREVNEAALEDANEGRILDYADMSWEPEPIDAGPNFRSSRNEDVVACILNLFPGDEFIKEVTSVFARHLLESSSPELAKETRLVELFKSRFDAAKLQHAEVMLSDIRRSTNVSNKMDKDVLSSIMDIQILSGYFWPPMRNNNFNFPAALDTAVENFVTNYMDQGYGSSQRKLLFRPALTKVSMTLDLEDRTVEEKDVPAWRASVLDAFTAPSTETHDFAQDDSFSDQVSLTADVLVQRLEMDAELVTDALAFWTSKRILYTPSPGAYAILERLDMASATAPSQAAAAPEMASVMSHDAILAQKAPMFEVFIVNMLRNGGPKAVDGPMGIAGMMRMVMQDFTYGEREVGILLAGLEGKGEVVRSGDMWSVAK